jgi:carboxylate-amine ligase
MIIDEPEFSMGIEEEYLLVDLENYDLTPAPEELMRECHRELEDQVSPEFLQCQIEVGTKVCKDAAEGRENLAHLRRTISDIAAQYGLAPLAASCHPFADWSRQVFTEKERYRSLEKELAGVARRMLICGMHVHVGLGDDDLRIDLMSQISYFLPHFLALSTSSPFWQGRDTGLNSYRLTVFDNLPRTGLPPAFTSYAEFQRSVQIIISSGLIQDASKIWWDVRPSSKFPTLETRICDVMPLLDDAVGVAALIQCVHRALYQLKRENKRWRQYDLFLIGENRWRAQRYGIAEGLIDFGRGEVVGFDSLLEELIEIVADSAKILNCTNEIDGIRNIVERGTSADRQRAVYQNSINEGASSHEALKNVARSLVEEFTVGL